MTTINQHSFTDCHALADALAERIADGLRAGLVERGAAVLAVSGGSTPKHLFARLAQAHLDWSKVTVTLVDERWVPESSDRSNARLVKSLLLQGAAAAARFVPLYSEAASLEEGVAATRARIDALPRPFDAVILGMGDDGHTASFFPGGDHLAEALDLGGRQSVLPMHAKGAGEPRITLTLPALLRTRELYLHIEGEAKRQVLADARLGLGAAKDYPIRAVLEQTLVPVAVYWCP